MRIVIMIVLFIFMLNVTEGNILISVIVPLLVGAALTYSKNSKAVTGHDSKEFDAEFNHNNIAINTNTHKIWLRDTSGKSSVFDKSDILRWRHEHANHGPKRYENKLIVDVRDLNMPVWTINFSRHNDNWTTGASKNFDEARDWQSRLTTWLG